MKITQRLMSGMISTFLSLCSFPCFANLKIINYSHILTFTVQCTGPMPGVPIPAGKTAELAWPMIQMIIGGLSGSCDFYSAGKHEAHAAVQLIPIAEKQFEAKITSLDVYDRHLDVALTPKINLPTQNITVVIGEK